MDGVRVKKPLGWLSIREGVCSKAGVFPIYAFTVPGSLPCIKAKLPFTPFIHCVTSYLGVEKHGLILLGTIVTQAHKLYFVLSERLRQKDQFPNLVLETPPYLSSVSCADRPCPQFYQKS